MNKNVFRLMVLAVSLASGSWVHGATVNWVGTAGDGKWETATNWSGSAVPTSSDDVTLGASETPYTVKYDFTSYNADSSSKGLKANTLTLNSGATLTFTGVNKDYLSWRVGKFTINDGATFNYQEQSRFPHATVMTDGSQDRYIQNGGNVTFTNYCSWDSGNYYVNGGNLKVQGGFFIGLSKTNVSVEITGGNILSTCTVGIGAREPTYKRTVTMSGGIWTATNGGVSNKAAGFAIGSGDNTGNGELLMTGGTLNVTQNYTEDSKEAGLLVGASLYNSGSNNGLLSISGTATVNTKGTLHIGGTTASKDKGTITLAGTGTLRAETVNVNDGATLNLTGGTLSASRWNGDLTLNGTTLSPETWEFTQDSTKSGTAQEYAYKQTSKFGSLTVSGALTIPTGGTSVVAVDVNETQTDVITAGSFDINGGTLQISAKTGDGAYGKANLNTIFQTEGTRTLNFTSTTVGTATQKVTTAGDGTLYITDSDETTWLGGTGDWQTATGWSQQAIPTTSEDVFILTGTVSTGTTTAPQAKVLTIGGDAVFNGQKGFGNNLTKFVVNGGTVEWSSGDRIFNNSGSIAETADYVFEMHGGKFSVTSDYATFGGGKILFDGGLFKVAATKTLILGIDGNAITEIKGTTSGNARIDVSNVTIGARYGGSYQTKNSTVNVSDDALMLIRGGSNSGFSGSTVGLVIGSGDNHGNGTVNQSGGTINVLSAGNVYVGATQTSARNAIGELNISAGVLNAVGTIYVGQFSSSTTGNQTGTLTLSGTGILRAGTIQPYTGKSTMTFTGGTLAVGTYKGNFVNAGTTIAPETWTLTRTSEIAKRETAEEYAYTQSSVFGTTTIEGTYTQNSGSVAIDLGGSSYDKINATSFTFNGGSVAVNWSGEYKAPGTDGLSYQFFVPTDSSATNKWLSALTYDSTISSWYDPVYDSTTGKLTLTQRVEESNNVAGNWDETTTWASGILPNEHTNVEIKQGTVTVPSGSGIVKAQTITVDGGKLVVAANGFDGASFQKFVVNSGTVEFNSEKRVIHNSGTFEMHGGTFTTSTRFATMNSGTFAYDGGLFRVTFENGSIVWGLEGTATTSVSGTARIDAPNVTLGARYGEGYTNRKSTLNFSGGTMLVRGGTWNPLAGPSVGLVIGSGDTSGTGELNLTGGTISVMNNEQKSKDYYGNVYVGSTAMDGITQSWAKKQINAKGTLNISGGTLNASGTMYIGLHPDRAGDETVPTQEGTLSLSGSGTLRVGKINIGTGGTTSFTGGTLAVGTYEGDFVNAGSTIAPETWTFTKSAETANANSALEWAYSQTSKIGTMRVNGAFTQNSGTIQIDLAADGTSDLILADSFDLAGGILSLDFIGEYDGSKNVYTLFGLNGSAAGTIDLSKLEVQMSESLKGTPYLLGSNGTFMLGYSASDVPEPATWLLLVLGIGGIFWRAVKNVKAR